MKALQEGQYIKHEQYGFGFVVESDADRTTIDFDTYGIKKFVTSLMTVALAGDAPPRPARPKRRKKAPATPATARVASGAPAGPK